MSVDKTPRKKVHQSPKIKHELQIRQLDWTEKQKEFIKLALDSKTRVILIKGPPGSSKSSIATYCGLELLNQKKISDIIYIRAAVESSDSKLGFLPGDLKLKMEYYNLPFADKLKEFLSESDIKILDHEERVTCFPINFARGMHWAAKSIILDECVSGDSKILTSKGRKKIKHLYDKFLKNKELPLALTFNEKSKSFEYKPILNIVNKGIKDTVKVIASNKKIVCTPDHLFLTQKGWVEASNLDDSFALVSTKESRSLKILNEDLLQIFLGSFLGDAGVDKISSHVYRLKEIHGIKQWKYCAWKANMFESKLRHIKENGFSKKPAVKYQTKCFFFENEFPKNKSDCPEWVMDNLNEKGLAIWYMDDGSINKAKNRVDIYTSSFPLHCQEMFVKKIKEKFGLEATISKDQGPDYCYFNLTFNAKNTRKLLKIVKPYIHPDLYYKLIENPQTYKWNNKSLEYGFTSINRVEINNQEEVYDMEIENNHNFIIASSSSLKSTKPYGVVVHNCQNVTHGEIKTIMTRLGEFSRLFILADPNQSDLPKNKQGGFEEFYNLFDDQESRDNGIFTFEFTNADIVRSGLCKYVVEKIENNEDLKNHQIQNSIPSNGKNGRVIGSPGGKPLFTNTLSLDIGDNINLEWSPNKNEINAQNEK